MIALGGCALQAAYSVFWSFAAVAVYQKFHPNSAGSNTSGGTASNSALIGLMVYMVFSFYWTSQFIVNYFLTIEAGIFVRCLSSPSFESPQASVVLISFCLRLTGNLLFQRPRGQACRLGRL